MVILPSGEKIEFNESSYASAIKRANNASKTKQLTPAQIDDIVEYVKYKYSRLEFDISNDEILDIIEDQIMSKGAYDTARCFDRTRTGKNGLRNIEDIDVSTNKEALKKIKIRKKNGALENYSASKLLQAVAKSAARARENGMLTDEESTTFVILVEDELAKKADEKVVTTKYMHLLAEKYLDKVAPDVGKAYTSYHSFRMGQAEIWEKITGQCTTLIGNGTDDETMAQKNQNANADSQLSSTQKCFFADYTAEEYYEQFFLTKEERQIADDGYLYWHDRNGRIIYTHNCCLFRMGEVLKNGFMMNGIWYNEPKTLDVAFDVIGDLTLMTASQQYGGFTIPRIDTILVPYAEKSFAMYKEKYLRLGLTEEKAENEAYNDICREMECGFQGLEYKFNTVASSRGDYPFTTISFGLDTSRFGRLASKICLKVRQTGQGKKGKKKPVLFPKLVFLYDKNLHGEGCVNYDIFEAGLECSSKTMYPDWLSLTGEGYVPSMYKKYGTSGVISPMGCRAFLSPYYERGGFEPADENDNVVFEGRFNLGVISLNLPMILAKAREEDLDFYETLDYYLEVIRRNHKRTYEFLGHMKASKNPVGFVYGGFYIPDGVKLGMNDEIAPALKAATMSFGITALGELQQLFNGKSLVEDGQFALEVMDHINKKIKQFKEEDHILYAIYGTPAESLCHKQVSKFRAKYGIVKNVSDRDYVSNSFHCHVTEHITPIEKQDYEYRFWNYFNGGKIQYCKYPIDYNTLAMKTLILRAMEMGFYEGVNLSLSFCDDCGYSQLKMGSRCPKCGGYHITQIDRMNGYLAFTRVGDDTVVKIDDDGNQIILIHSRYSPAKNKEIADRVSM